MGLLLPYTEGGLEARRQGELFGQQRFVALLKRRRLNVQRQPHMVLDQVLAFSEGTLHDDVAVLALSLTATAPRAARPFAQETLLN